MGERAGRISGRLEIDAAPIGENSLTLFAVFETHTLPVASIATPVG